jgi:pimeloyl-ACP methyl ester carboxylesterase
MSYADSDGVRIHYEVAGAHGPAVLCLPGWCADTEQFAPTTELLATDHRVIVVDWRGHGSSGPAPHDFGHTALADDAAAVLAAAGIENVFLLSTAQAGWVALELRRRLGSRIEGILALSWMVLGAPPPFLGALAGMQDPARWEDVRQRTFALWTDDYRNPEASRYVREHMARQGYDMWSRAGREIALAFDHTPNPLRAFAEVGPPAPFIHLYALPDDPAYLQAQRDFAARSPWFEVERFAGRTHFPSIEAPERVAETVRRLTRTTLAGAPSRRAP